MKHCYRCGESKDDYRFRPNQPYWHQWCIRCERSPVGNSRCQRRRRTYGTTATKYHRHNLRKLQIPSNEMLQK
ncbi:TPA: protein NinD [Salmonella enterica subsp. enterica serovar Havana]